MGIHLLPPLFEMVIAPPAVGGVLLISHDPTYAGSEYVFTDQAVGNTFQHTQAFKLTKIIGRLNKVSETVCTSGICKVYETPSVGNSLPAELASATTVLPSLAAHPDSTWVEFVFNQVALEANHLYLYLIWGCSAYLNEPYFRVAHANEEGYCVGCSRWLWRPRLSSKKLDEAEGTSCQHEIYGILS